MDRSRQQMRRVPPAIPAAMDGPRVPLFGSERDSPAGDQGVPENGLLDVDGGCVALQMTFLNSPSSVPAIHALVRRVTGIWGYATQFIDDAELVASELTANAVLHSQADYCDCFNVRLKPGYQRLRIEVADTGSSLPRQKAPVSRTETGRGLLLVEALCGRWGVVRETPGGKTVWAELVTSAP
jgi:anti-sigma regulatory factor (Ser/Thr protein kinase)